MPNDYSQALTKVDLSRSQTLQGMGDLERRALLRGRSTPSLRDTANAQKHRRKWPPNDIFRRLQQMLILRGGGLPVALKHYSCQDGRGNNSGMTVSKEDMRIIIKKRFRIPATDAECDAFYRNMRPDASGNLSFPKLFQVLDVGIGFGAKTKPPTVPGPADWTVANPMEPDAVSSVASSVLETARTEDSWASLATSRASASSLGPQRMPETGRGATSRRRTPRPQSAKPSARQGRSSASSMGRRTPRPQSARSSASRRPGSAASRRSKEHLAPRPQSALSSHSRRTADAAASMASSRNATRRPLSAASRRSHGSHRSAASALRGLRRPQSAASSRGSLPQAEVPGEARKQSARSLSASSSAKSILHQTMRSWKKMQPNRSLSRSHSIIAMAMSSAAHFRRLRALAATASRNSAKDIYDDHGEARPLHAPNLNKSVRGLY